MKISSIKMEKNYDSKKIKAVATVTFDNFLVVKNIKLQDMPNGILITMPNMQYADRKRRDICYPINEKYKEYIDNKILSLYHSYETERVFAVYSPALPKTTIQIKLINDREKYLLARADIVFDDSFCVQRFFISEKYNGNKKYLLSSKERLYDTTYPINDVEIIKFNDILSEKIMEAYYNEDFWRYVEKPKKEEQESFASEVGIIDNELKEYSLEIFGYPTFKFYFPANLGIYSKVSGVEFAIFEEQVQKVRVMISKCYSTEELENGSRDWIEKQKSDSKLEEVLYRKENINNVPIEVFVLKYVEHEEWPCKIYKIGFFEGYRITISGWLVKGREEIINQAFEKLEIDSES